MADTAFECNANILSQNVCSYTTVGTLPICIFGIEYGINVRWVIFSVGYLRGIISIRISSRFGFIFERYRICIVGDDNRILSIGYNGTPNGFNDDQFPWKREGSFCDTKYAYVCHAELNSILNYRGNRKDFVNAKMYVELFPCNECAKAIIQTGIKEIIYLCMKNINK